MSGCIGVEDELGLPVKGDGAEGGDPPGTIGADLVGGGRHPGR